MTTGTVDTATVLRRQQAPPPGPGPEPPADSKAPSKRPGAESETLDEPLPQHLLGLLT